MKTLKVGGVVLVNPADRSWTRHRYVLWFGAYGSERLMVWANSLDDALDECIDYLADNAPGLLCDEEVAEAYRDARARGLSEDAAHADAEVDTACAGNCGHYVQSGEWGIVSEDPDRAEVLAILGVGQ